MSDLFLLNIMFVRHSIICDLYFIVGIYPFYWIMSILIVSSLGYEKYSYRHFLYRSFGEHVHVFLLSLRMKLLFINIYVYTHTHIYR